MNTSRRTFLALASALIPMPALAGKMSYSYDALGRLTDALHADGALTVYEYDAAGNRTAVREPFVGTGVTDDCFDPVYYLRANPDVARAGVDPYAHFFNTGWREGRSPNSLFDTTGYLAAYPDIAAAGINPLTHYSNYGWIERRDPSGLFGTKEYLDLYPDIVAAGLNPLRHYLQFGYLEGRNPGGDGAFRPV